MRKVITLVLITVAAGFGQANTPKSLFTLCPRSLNQPKCVLQEALTTQAPTKTASLVDAITATPGPFQQEFDMKIFDGANAVVARVDIPAGMQMVIESVSTYATVPGGQLPRVSVSTTVKGSAATYFVPLAKQDSADGQDWLLGNRAIRVYADSAAAFIVVTRPQTSGDTNFAVVVSGTLTSLSQ
jgi:hypothetical protein